MLRNIFICCLLFLGCESPDVTTQNLPPLPEPLTNNAVAYFENDEEYSLYTFGGIDSTLEYSGIHLRSYKYNSTARSWTRLEDLPDTLGKVAASASRIGDIIYIIGGYYVFEDAMSFLQTRFIGFIYPLILLLTMRHQYPLLLMTTCKQYGKIA